jgi:signal transduction histidine kinase, nitrogen specific, ntrB
MGGANFRQKNLLKDLIYLGQTRPVNKQTVKGLFRFALEPLLEAQTQKAVVLTRLFDSTELDGVLKRLEFTNAEVYSFDNTTKGENLQRDDIWGETEFLVLLSPRYSACLLWDYSTETVKDTSCLYYLLNSRDVNNVIRIISENSKIDLMRYTQEYTPERRSNELLNKSVHKFINFADSFVEEAALTQAEAGLLGQSDDIAKKYEYISTKAKIISHDIKNHLSIIDLYSKIMEKRLENVANKELQDSMSNAVLSIQKSKQAIGELLTELRTIQGAKLETHNFSKILQNAIELVQAKAMATSTKFEVSNKFNANVLCDENKLLNIMINLFYNALDSIESAKTQGVIKINTEETADNMLKIYITDNGCGIEQDACEKIFEEGYTSKTTGSGLGLHISKEAMKEQYGDLNLVNSEKGSTTFVISLPKL